jgi:phage host-nuclease inhibitor protein Gam
MAPTRTERVIMNTQTRVQLLDHANDVAEARLAGLVDADAAIAADRQAEIDRQASRAGRDLCTPWQTQIALGAVGCFVGLADLALMPWNERLLAHTWATNVLDEINGVSTAQVIGRPDWLPPRDAASIAGRLEDDHESHGGIIAARHAYQEEWHEPETMNGDDDSLEADYEIVDDGPPAPTFLDQLLGIDAEIADDLEAVGINIERPQENDNARLQVFADRLLRRAAIDEEQLAENRAAEQLEINIIRNSHAERRRIIERRRDGALALAEQLAPMFTYRGKSKTVNLAYGAVGFTDYKAKAKITDVEAAAEWARTNLPAAVSYQPITEIKTVLDRKAVSAHALATGEEPPGVAIEPASTEYFARPRMPANPDEFGHAPTE